MELSLFFNLVKKEIIPIFVVVIVSILISIPLTVPGFYTVHDDQQIARLFLLDSAIKGGQFPPRWVDQLGFGFGYPLFIFYPPLVYYVGEAFHLLGFSLIDSVKLVFFSSILFSALAIYILVKELWGRLEAVVAAIFYMLLPYRAIDIYVRGAMAESFSFVFPPLIIWSLYLLRKTNDKKYIYFSAIFLSLLMITHNLIFLPFTIILALFLVFLTFQKNKYKLIYCKNVAKSFILALCLSAFFWLPAIIEKKYTIVDSLLLVNLASYSIHFVYPQQLWNWPWGFGGSSSGLSDGISFKIGKLHVLLSFISAIISTAYFFLKSKSKNSRQNSLLVLSVFILFVFSAFMTTYYSKSIWDILSPLSYLQFPWRYLIFVGLFASVLAGAFIYYLKLPILKLSAAFLIVGLLLLTNLKLFRPQTFRPDLTDESATSGEFIKWDISSSSFEYIPKGVPLYVGALNTNVVDIQKKDTDHSLIEADSDIAQIKALNYTPSKTEFVLDLKEDTKLKANIFNFPGWRVSVNDESTPIDDQNRFKLITFNAPKGESKIKIEFLDTPIRSVSNWISFSSFAFLIFLIAKKWRTQK